ncbi:hypothetical protein MT418_007234 [Batrachochytrium dendrobatidis]
MNHQTTTDSSLVPLFSNPLISTTSYNPDCRANSFQTPFFSSSLNRTENSSFFPSTNSFANFPSRIQKSFSYDLAILKSNAYISRSNSASSIIGLSSGSVSTSTLLPFITSSQSPEHISLPPGLDTFAITSTATKIPSTPPSLVEPCFSVSNDSVDISTNDCSESTTDSVIESSTKSDKSLIPDKHATTLYNSKLNSEFPLLSSTPSLKPLTNSSSIPTVRRVLPTKPFDPKPAAIPVEKAQPDAPKHALAISVYSTSTVSTVKLSKKQERAARKKLKEKQTVTAMIETPKDHSIEADAQSVAKDAFKTEPSTLSSQNTAVNVSKSISDESASVSSEYLSKLRLYTLFRLLWMKFQQFLVERLKNIKYNKPRQSLVPNYTIHKSHHQFQQLVIVKTIRPVSPVPKSRFQLHHLIQRMI